MMKLLLITLGSVVATSADNTSSLRGKENVVDTASGVTEEGKASESAPKRQLPLLREFEQLFGSPFGPAVDDGHTHGHGYENSHSHDHDTHESSSHGHQHGGGHDTHGAHDKGYSYGSPFFFPPPPLPMPVAPIVPFAPVVQESGHAHGGHAHSGHGHDSHGASPVYAEPVYVEPAYVEPGYEKEHHSSHAKKTHHDNIPTTYVVPVDAKHGHHGGKHVNKGTHGAHGHSTDVYGEAPLPVYPFDP